MTSDPPRRSTWPKTTIGTPPIGLSSKYENDPTAAWIHAVLHKIEGDLDNSRYWYRQAGKMECVDQEPMGRASALSRR